MFSPRSSRSRSRAVRTLGTTPKARSVAIRDTSVCAAEQMAQMEQTVAQTETIQEQFALTMRMAAMGVVGQQVSYYDADGTVVTGEALSASFAASVPSIKVGDTDVALDSILSVNSTPKATDA